MSQLPLRAIEAFVAAARARSLAGAATSLNITVPAVSRRIAILEQHLGVKLFRRLPRGLELTDAGEKYFTELAPAWDIVRNATEAARAPAHRKPFKVSVMPTFAANWLLPRLAQGRGPWRGLASERFPSIEAYPVASPAFLASEQDLQGPQDLARYTLIGSNHQPDFWPEWFRLSGIAFKGERHRSFDNLQLVYEAAAAGLGIAIGLDPLLRPYLASGRLKRLWPGEVTLSRSFHLVRRDERVIDRPYERFREWLLGEARSQRRTGCP